MGPSVSVMYRLDSDLESTGPRFRSQSLLCPFIGRKYVVDDIWSVSRIK